MKKVLRWFWPFWKNRRKGMLSVILVTVLAILVKTLYPFIFKFVIDSLEGEIDLQNVRHWVFIILGLGIVQQITQWLLPVMRYMHNLLLAQDVRLQYFETIIGKDYTFFNKFRTGDLITRLTDDIDGDLKLSWYSCSGVMRPIEAGLALLFSIALMMTLSWKLTIIAMIPLPVVIWIMAKTEHVQSRAYKKRQQLTSETTEVLESAFSGIRIVVGYVTEKAQYRLFENSMKKRVKAEEDVVFIRSVLESLGGLINQVGLVVVLFAGGYFVIREWISLGDFYAFVAYLSGMTETIWTISWFLVSTKLAEASLDRMIELEGSAPVIKGQINIRPKSAKLKFENIDFGYNKENKPVLQKINFSILPAETVALVGSVGSGKTTILNIAAGTVDPDRGDVWLDQVKLFDLCPALRSQLVGFVPQEVILFSGTVAENISMGRTGVEDSVINRALFNSVAAAEFSGQKEIKQGGVGLSGGQRARVAVARAIAHKPVILLMDDVTSALDAATEKELWQRLREDLPDSSILVTTHREATAKIADRVLWLKDGKIIKEGSHQHLMEKYRGYQRLFAKK